MKVRSAVVACGAMLGAFLVVQNAGAVVTYETNSSVQFTFAPILSLTLSADGFVINGMTPGISKDSNEVTATVTTNNVTGYTLSATVGNETYDHTNLVYGANTFAMMGSGTALTPGTWGYTVDDGTTYGALDRTNSTILNKTVDVAGTAAGGYIGTNVTPIKVGAYAADDQPNGIYRNVMNFAAVVNPMLPIYSISSMQAFGSMTAEQKAEVIASMDNDTTYLVADTRDNQTYQIAKLKDGKVWMTTNLNLGATNISTDLTSANTNLSTTISAADFNSYKKTSGSGTFVSPEYISATGNDTTAGGPGTPYGTLYNYCAVTAGTICTDSNVADAAYDICPAGWRLPTGGDGGEFSTLYAAYGSYGNMRAPVSEGGAAFAFTGGFYDGPWGISSTRPSGGYWSSTAYPNVDEYDDGVNPPIQGYISTYIAGLSGYQSRFYTVGYQVRAGGDAVRCVLK